MFQSPIRRGRRCNCHGFIWAFLGGHVSVPYSSGQSLQSDAPRCVGVSVAVSVPYSSGQSLQCEKPRLVARLGEFQSPIRRGSRCNPFLPAATPGRPVFQSPIRRGRRCNAEARRARRAGTGVSVPYLSGQALQSGIGSRFILPFYGFSPLFVGAGVAMRRPPA